LGPASQKKNTNKIKGSWGGSRQRKRKEEKAVLLETIKFKKEGDFFSLFQSLWFIC